MKKNVFTKTFDNEVEMKRFVDTNVGEDRYYEIRPNWVNIDGLTMTIAMKNGKYFGFRRRICESNGFVMERKDV